MARKARLHSVQKRIKTNVLARVSSEALKLLAPSGGLMSAGRAGKLGQRHSRSRPSSTMRCSTTASSWLEIVSDMADANHPMPRELRQNFVNIGLPVMNHTVVVMMLTRSRSAPRPPLININREIAAGLLGRA